MIFESFYYFFFDFVAFCLYNCGEVSPFEVLVIDPALGSCNYENKGKHTYVMLPALGLWVLIYGADDFFKGCVKCPLVDI